MLCSRFGSTHPGVTTSAVGRSLMSIQPERQQSQLPAHPIPAQFPFIVIFIPILFSETHRLAIIGGRLRPCFVAMRFTSSSRRFNESTICTAKFG